METCGKGCNEHDRHEVICSNCSGSVLTHTLYLKDDIGLMYARPACECNNGTPIIIPNFAGAIK